MGTRGAAGRADNNGTGLGSVPVSATPPGAVLTSDPAARQFGDEGYGVEVVYSGSDQDSDSGDDEDAVGSGGERRGVKRGRGDRDVRRQSAANSGVLAGGYGGVGPGVPGAKPGKKTRGRVKIKMEFIDNKLRRYTTFSKRKTGIMKKVGEQRAKVSGLGLTSISDNPLTAVLLVPCNSTGERMELFLITPIHCIHSLNNYQTKHIYFRWLDKILPELSSMRNLRKNESTLLQTSCTFANKFKLY